MRLLILCLLLLPTSSFARTVTIMNYNIENLFDTLHDPGKLDYTYLPKKVKDASTEIQKYCKAQAVHAWREECLNLDWNEEIVDAKMQNIARVIKASNSGKGPDILVLEEVENKRILKQLVIKNLAGYGYKYISLIEGEDERGIDVGMISRFPILSEKLHTINIKDEHGHKNNTRGILEVTFKVDKKTVTVFGNHWPSQGNPSSHRLKASEVLLEKAKKSTSDLVVATGDFNTLATDKPHGLQTNILPYFVDVEAEARHYKELNPGTHWYMTEWSSLDRLFVLKTSLDSNVSIRFQDFEIQAFDFVVGPKRWTNYETGEVTVYQGVPYRFYPQNKTGYSDHLSIIGSFEL